MANVVRVGGLGGFSMHDVSIKKAKCDSDSNGTSENKKKDDLLKKLASDWVDTITLQDWVGLLDHKAFSVLENSVTGEFFQKIVNLQDSSASGVRNYLMMNRGEFVASCTDKLSYESRNGFRNMIVSIEGAKALLDVGGSRVSEGLSEFWTAASKLVESADSSCAKMDSCSSKATFLGLSAAFGHKFGSVEPCIEVDVLKWFGSCDMKWTDVDSLSWRREYSIRILVCCSLDLLNDWKIAGFVGADMNCSKISTHVSSSSYWCFSPVFGCCISKSIFPDLDIGVRADYLPERKKIVDGLTVLSGRQLEFCVFLQYSL
jgi:hypothetical protein